jgi:hypothetical protein
MLKKLLSSMALSALLVSGAAAGEVTLAWDANIEDDLAGYKIYYGKVSRYDPVVAMGVPLAIQLGCQLPDTGPLTEVQQECKDSWEKYCTCIEWEVIAGVGTGKCKTAPDPPDPACDYDYFDYDGVVDVKNVTEHTLTLPDGHYFLAATAYDEDYPVRNHESKFSIELSHTIDNTPPEEPLQFKKIPPIKEEGSARYK